MALFPKNLEKYLYPSQMWVERNEWKELILRDWIFAFFAYALAKNRSFYWAWDKFMITYQKGRSGKGDLLTIDIPLPSAPFLFRQRYSVSFSKGEMFALFVDLYDSFLGSTRTLRNLQASSRPFLSFQTFVEMCYNKDVSFSIPKVSRDQSQHDLIHEIVSVLSAHGVQPRDRCLAQQTRKFTIPSLRQWLRS